MQIKFSVDQRAAIIAGVDAASATIELEVQPAWLTPVERKVLSEILTDPNEATQLGITWYEGEPAGDANGVKVRLLMPSLDGLRTAIAEALAKAIDRHDAQYARSVSVEDWVA